MNNERLGEIRNNKFGTPMKIIRYGCYNDIDVEFLDENHYIKEHNTYSNFKTGGIKNPYDKTLFGVGYVGVGEHMKKGRKKLLRNLQMNIRISFLKRSITQLWRMNLGLKTIRIIENVFEITNLSTKLDDTTYSIA